MPQVTWTLTLLKSKINRDLDLTDENFIDQTTELRDYIREAIDDVGRLIHNTYERYFKSKANIAITSGTQAYSLPSDIFARKIIKLMYDNGSDKYEIKPVRDDGQKHEDRTGMEYIYDIDDVLGTGTKIKLYPTPAETSSTNITIYYHRQPKLLTSSSDECDIPEFASLVIRKAKNKCLMKEFMGNVPADAKLDEARLEEDLRRSLAPMRDDGNDDIPPDTSHYDEYGQQA